MKNLTRLVLAGVLALSSPFLIPATHAESQTRRSQDVRIDRLGAEFFPEGRRGAVITALDAGSPLRGHCVVGDSIIEIDGDGVTNALDLINDLEHTQPDSRVTLKIRRKNAVFDEQIMIR